LEPISINEKGSMGVKSSIAYPLDKHYEHLQFHTGGRTQLVALNSNWGDKIEYKKITC